MLRPFDPDLLAILKTEVPLEKRLREDVNVRAAYMEDMARHSGDASVYRPLKNPVTVSRKLRWVPTPPHRTFLVEMLYMVSGRARLIAGKQEIILYPRDILLPSQYTILSMDELGEDDILLSFNMKPRFFEDTYMRIKSNTILAEFMLDILRKDISWNRFLHFSGIEDIIIHDLIEVLAAGAYPYLDAENVRCGVDPDPDITSYLMGTLFAVLSHEMANLQKDSVTSYNEIIKQTVSRYVGEQYKTASLQELAHIVNQSDSVLSRQIKSIFGITFKEILLQTRFKRAEALLRQTTLPVTDVAEAVGYENASFFYRRFREIYGISPNDCRKQPE